MRQGNPTQLVWVNLRWMHALMPYLRSSLRDLVASFEPDAAQSFLAAGTCVVHYRAGDFQVEQSVEEVARTADAVVAAAGTFKTRCKHFELLDGGVTTHFCKDGGHGQDDCGGAPRRGGGAGSRRRRTRSTCRAAG